MQKRSEKVPGSSPFLSLPEAATYLGLNVQTMYQWRSKAIGPPGLLIGNRVKYRKEGLDAWISEREQAEADRVARIAG
jgi:predicted DNA-binding transcriptional regulator AlpA